MNANLFRFLTSAVLGILIFFLALHWGVAREIGPGVPVGMFLLVMALLVLNFIEFTTTKEGTGQAIMTLGGYWRMVIQWKGYVRNEEGRVVPGFDWWSSLFGGFRIVGIRFVHYIFRYVFRWRRVEMKEGGDQIEFHDEEIDYIFLRPAVYPLIIEAAETRPPERMALKVVWLVTIQVVNPERALFKSPSNNWLEAALNKLSSSLTLWVPKHTLDDLLELKNSPEEIWKGHDVTVNEEGGGTKINQVAGLKDDPLLKNEFVQWGLEIPENGIVIKEISLPPDLQEAAVAQRKMELLSKGFAAKTFSALVSMLAVLTDSTVEDVQNEFKTSQTTAWKKYEQWISICLDLIKRNMGLEVGAVSQVYVEDGKGEADPTMTRLLALTKAWRGEE